MASKKSVSFPEVGGPTVSPEVGIKLIQKQIQCGKELLSKPPVSEDIYYTWSNTTRDFLGKAFGANSHNERQVTDVGRYGTMPNNKSGWEQHYLESLQSKITRMEGLVTQLQTELEISTPTVLSTSAPSTIKISQKIFVSHSNSDHDLAGAVVDMLCKALRLGNSDFRCTSVDGSKLPGGAETNSQLRQEIINFPAFISILTPQSMESTYVLFELGARWGCSMHHIPLLAKGVHSNNLRQPLSGINALDLSKEAEVIQFAGDLGKRLNIQVEPTHGYLKEVKAILEKALQIPVSKTPPTASNKLSDELDDDSHKILNLFFHSQEDLSMEEVAAGLNIGFGNVNYQFSLLMHTGFLQMNNYIKPAHYGLTFEGQRYAKKNCV